MDKPKPMKELTRRREERGLSQQGLADASSVNKATINQIERGRRSPNLETLEKLAAALDVEVADLFPKAQAPLFRELPASATREERRAKWVTAVRKARQLREHGRARLEGLLSSWHESRERGEPLDARGGYLDKMGELLQEAYDAEMDLFGSAELLGPDELAEVQVADRFYVELWHLVQGAGLSIRTGADEAAGSSISAGLEDPPTRTAAEAAPHTVEEPEAA
jgi:transcriptional regulator with XRE-family HTH domain